MLGEFVVQLILQLLYSFGIGVILISGDVGNINDFYGTTKINISF